MIINCIKCNIKFNVDNNLIPDQGRLLKCGKCGIQWFFKLDNNENIKLDDKASQENEINNIEKEDAIIDNSNDDSKNNENTLEDQVKTPSGKKNKINSISILSLLIVFLITFVGIILLIDTLKLYIANFFPNIITILNSLYATLHDLILFFKDLFN